jgi:hypothetical protein
MMDAPTRCTCTDRSRHIAVDEISIVLSCVSCGGWSVIFTDSIDGCMEILRTLKADRYRAMGEIHPPGKAVVTTCADCGGAGCRHCDGSGKALWKACPRCGDIGFDFVNRTSPDRGMICRLGCGHKWAADDPRWLAQEIPA